MKMFAAHIRQQPRSLISGSAGIGIDFVFIVPMLNSS